MKGLGALFTPFGEGHHAFPGRRFATKTILTTVATMVSVFEFVLLDAEEGWRHAELQHGTFGYTPARQKRSNSVYSQRQGWRAQSNLGSNVTQTFTLVPRLCKCRCYLTPVPI
jgi:hypothetical protein